MSVVAGSLRVYIPCSHDIVATKERDVNPFILCSRLHSVKSLVLAYVESILPFGHVSECQMEKNVELWNPFNPKSEKVTGGFPTSL